MCTMVAVSVSCYTINTYSMRSELKPGSAITISSLVVDPNTIYPQLELEQGYLYKQLKRELQNKIKIVRPKAVDRSLGEVSKDDKQPHYWPADFTTTEHLKTRELITATSRRMCRSPSEMICAHHLEMKRRDQMEIKPTRSYSSHKTKTKFSSHFH